MLPSVVTPGYEQNKTKSFKSIFFYLLCKLGRLDFYKCCTHSLQVTALIVKSDTSRTWKSTVGFYVQTNQRRMQTNIWTHLWGTCVCLCQCQRTWLLQRDRSWCWPAPRRSACRAVHPQTPSYWDPDAGPDSARSCCLRSPRGSPEPGAVKVYRLGQTRVWRLTGKVAHHVLSGWFLLTSLHRILRLDILK